MISLRVTRTRIDVCTRNSTRYDQRGVESDCEVPVEIICKTSESLFGYQDSRPAWHAGAQPFAILHVPSPRQVHVCR